MGRKLLNKKVLKPKNKHMFFGLLKNDLEFVDSKVLRDKIHQQSHFSLLYLMLLTSSVLVCTLGLLTNSTAIIIGGMLIAPLMWPLARLGYGIALRSPRHLYRGALLVMASVLIGSISAYVITSISPIKVINSEILARTTPTLMDLFIALAAGFVAAIAITQKKIADSLAGVAIAVSLMPPLCTAGIALSLREYSFSVGALLLFTVNAACITLVTTLVLVYTHYARTKEIHIAKKAAIFNLVVVLLLAIPLVQFLRNYSFEIRSYRVVTTEMENFIDQKDAAAEFENIEISQSDRETMSISADLLIPSDLAFTYEDNESLISRLEEQINKKVLLNLKIQSIIEPISKNQRESETMIENLRSQLSDELVKLEESFKINSISIAQAEVGWSITADILVAPDIAPTSSEVSTISDALAEKFDTPVDLNLTFVPRLTLRSSEQTTSEEAKKIVERITSQAAVESQISSFTLAQKNGRNNVAYTIVANSVDPFSREYLELIKTSLTTVVGQNLDLNVRILQATDIAL